MVGVVVLVAIMGLIIQVADDLGDFQKLGAILSKNHSK